MYTQNKIHVVNVH